MFLAYFSNFCIVFIFSYLYFSIFHFQRLNKKKIRQFSFIKYRLRATKSTTIEQPSSTCPVRGQRRSHQMCVKCRSPAMRHVMRTHRVDLDWLFERIHKDPSIAIKWIGTLQQLADIFTKGSFSEATWRQLCAQFLIGDSFPRVAPHNKSK